MVKKILVTGSNGFIGKNLVEFYSTKYDVITLTRNDNIKDKLNENPDIVINTAASIYDLDGMFETNVVLVNHILEYIRQTKNKFIQIGSSAEYGKKTVPSKEQDILEPVIFYAGTKAAATLMCQSLAKEFTLPIFIIRPYSVYGNYEKAYRLFPRLYNAFAKQDKMTLTEGYHDFIYIKDFVRGLNLFVENDFENYGDIINLGSGQQTSNTEVFQQFVNIFGFVPPNIEISHGLSKSFESKTWICDTEYAKNKYGFVTEYSLRQGILDYIKTRKGNEL